MPWPVENPNVSRKSRANHVLTAALGVVDVLHSIPEWFLDFGDALCDTYCVVNGDLAIVGIVMAVHLIVVGS